VRIIGGEYRRRLIEFPAAEGLRPTPDRVRETLFNWLGQDLTGKRCLDLFAGSGALGFEAASRGAGAVVMVESNRSVFRALQENCKRLACAGVTLHCADGLEFVRRQGGQYDVVFLDPPFDSDYPRRVLPLLEDRLAGGGRVYLETGAPFQPDAAWQTLKRARAGNVHYQLLQRSMPEHDKGDISRDV
jgi:16S rRNA (guanine966-N2)-methyltransferase